MIRRNNRPAQVELVEVIQATSPILAEVPVLLKSMPNWVQWKLVPNEDGELGKVPFIAGTDKHASSTRSSTWTTFEEATKNITLSSTQGVGFVIHGEAVETNLVGFDLDGCRNPRTGELTQWAEDMVDCLDSYTEVTPSQTGVRIWVIGKLPGTDHVFNLDSSAGFGRKIKIEVFDRARYFTITGDALFDEAVGIETRDLAQAYKLCQEIKAKFPPVKAEPAATSEDSIHVTDGAKIQSSGSVITSKLELLMHGEIVSTRPFGIADGQGNLLEYPSHSEADMALCTALALKHGNNPDLIFSEYENSSLYREKWGSRSDYFKENTIAKAIRTAEKINEAQTSANASRMPIDDYSKNVSAVAPESLTAEDLDEDAIPPFDPSVANGIYADFVELVTRGTTLAPQFAYVIAKTIVGLRMAGKVKFETLDAEPRYYTALIGETGSGKGEAWRRTSQILHPEGALVTCKLKLVNSMDSGAGIKDLFFEPPEDEPVFCYVDEIVGFGNKASETRNPAILDTMIELADSTSISRSLAKSRGGTKTKHDARLGMVLCGQDGMTYAKACAGRTKMGFWDRLYPEFGVPVETGDLPPVPVLDAITLLSKLNSLDYSGGIKMASVAATRLEEFWNGQPTDVRRKARFKKNLILDAYMSAFGRGSRTVEMPDMDIAIRIFTRQLVIRKICFTTEVPDRVGHYISICKKLTERMERQLERGVSPEIVALSRRDFEKTSHAHRDNETHIFARAFDVHSKVWLRQIKIRKTNGQEYTKYLPETND